MFILNKIYYYKNIFFRNTFGNINYFGGTSKHLLRSSVKLKDEMNRDQSRQILFFSDLWLDDAVVRKLLI